MRSRRSDNVWNSSDRNIGRRHRSMTNKARNDSIDNDGAGSRSPFFYTLNPISGIYTADA